MPAVRQNKEDSESSSEEELVENQFCIFWSGVSRNIPVLLFHAETVVSKDGNLRTIGERYNLAFKILRTESRLVRGILLNHGFREVHPNSNDFSLMWTGSHLKTYQLRSLQDFQKVNHFPRSNELTRKDRLYKNIQRMQRAHGFQKFHIVPQTFVLPAEYQEFCTTFCKDKGTWIIKPVASSRGRGIYLVSSPSQIPLDENILVSRYISSPLLVDDFKFDVRLYVLVTSYDPVIIYIYEEGLTRFATVKYDRAVKNIKNQFMHLTNYSVNKKSSDYVSCDDPEVEDYGNKWSMSALLRYLRQEGKDTTLLMGQIEDLIIKTVLSAEMQIATACKMFVSHRSNCFELYGFDVLIDSNLKPWLLEVNLSPSLACDTPLDLKIKANMISDMFSLVGFVCQDTLQKQARSEKAAFDHSVKTQSLKCQTAFAKSKMCQRTQSANSADAEEQKIKQGGKHMGTLDLTAEELKVLRRTQEEFERRGGFIRIFPTPQTWELYSGYLEYKTSMNSMLANKLFHGRSGKSAVITQSRNKPKGIMPLEVDALKTCHIAQYERKLLSLEALKHRRRHLTDCATAGRKKTGRRLSPSSACSSENEEANEREEREPQGKQEHTMSLAHTDIQPTLRERLRTEEQFPARVSKRRVDLLHILQQGWDLSKVQARMAFSSYLHRVQTRLLAEGRANSRSAWAQKEDDQMELIIRFLKRAASNLQQDVRVELPSCQLSLPDRRRLLAHQLGEFIHCYNKETKEMVKSLKKNEDEDQCINPNAFQEFILEASESDLEDVLTFYTHKNKSASVFLGSKCPKSSRTDCDKECHEGMGDPAKHYGRKTQTNAKEGSSPPESSVTSVKARHAKNEETHESTAKPGYNKTSETVKTDTHCITIQSKSNKSVALSNVKLRNGIRNGDTATEVQPETLTTSETQNNDIKIKTIQNGDFGSNRPRLTVVENGNALSKMVKVNNVQPETLRGSKDQARFRGSQHTSSYPAALDCEQIHLQHCFPPSKPEGQPQLQPPPYIQPPPHLQAGTPHKVQTTLSSTNTLCLVGSQEKAEVLQRTQLSHSAQAFSNIASLDTVTRRSAANTYSQKLVWPPSAEQASLKACKSRPASAELFKEPDSPSVQAQSNQRAIVSALKKLVEKQAARQYSTSSHISLLTQHLTNLNLARGVFSKGALGLTDVVQSGAAKTHHSDTNLSGTVRCETEAATGRPAYNLATGTTAQQSHEPTLGSYQLQFAIRQLQQQKLQTRKLLDQSRTRHQAILAAHTITSDAIPRNSNNSSCGVQANQQSQMNMKQTMSSKPHNLSQGVTVHTSKLPSSTPRDTLSCKVDTQQTKQAPCKGPSSNRLSSLSVYDGMCGKTGPSVYSKLFQTHESSHR